MTNINPKISKTKASKESVSCLQRLNWIGNTIFHQLVAVAAVFILWTLFYNYGNGGLSRWHMILAATAYVPLMSEAIVLFATENVWTQNIPRKTRYYIHGSFMFTSAVFASIGIGFMISIHHVPHFSSTHAWTGLVSWIFVLLSQFLGVASAYSYSLKFIMRPVWFKFIHNLFGHLGYLFGITSLCYGIQKHAFTTTTSEDSRTAMTVIIAIIAAWSIMAALKSGYNQLKAIIT